MECELYLMIDENGKYTVATDVDDLDPGNHDDAKMMKIVKVIVSVTLPTMQTIKVNASAEE